MVGRRWDAVNVNGKYIGTEFLLLDSKGDIIHCVARSAIAHCFSGNLLEGEIIGNFLVISNRDSYHVRKYDSHVIQLEGNTVVKRLDSVNGDFVRHPFELIPIEDIELSGSKFLIDVMGCAINLGKIKPTRNISQMVEFHLINDRGRSIKVTLWGSLCNSIEKLSKVYSPPIIVVLTGMNVKEFRGEMYLSSTSATCIFDKSDVPDIRKFRELIGAGKVPKPVKALDVTKVESRTLAQLLDMGRARKDSKSSSTVSVVGRITEVRQKNSWHYFSCGKGNCKKGLTRADGQFWCDACKINCEFPLIRYRIHMEVSDGMSSFVLTMFDDVAEL